MKRSIINPLFRVLVLLLNDVLLLLNDVLVTFIVGYLVLKARLIGLIYSGMNTLPEIKFYF